MELLLFQFESILFCVAKQLTVLCVNWHLSIQSLFNYSSHLSGKQYKTFSGSSIYIVRIFCFYLFYIIVNWTASGFWIVEFKQNEHFKDLTHTESVYSAVRDTGSADTFISNRSIPRNALPTAAADGESAFVFLQPIFQLM